MSWENGIDILTLLGLFTGIMVAAYYQRETVQQMRRQSDATVESLSQLNDQTQSMQQQTIEMRQAMENETRPVLFAMVLPDSKLVIGNQGRNPASNLTIEFSEPVLDAKGDLSEEVKRNYPILPGGFQLVFDLYEEAAVAVLASKISKSVESRDVNAVADSVLSISIRYRDALTEQWYEQRLNAEVASTADGVSLEELPGTQHQHRSS